MLFPIRKRYKLAATVGVAVLALTACSAANPPQDADPAEPSGSLTVLTWIPGYAEDGTFAEMVERFKEKYPAVTDVDVQGISAYEDQVRTMMNTDDYGDVLSIPQGISKEQLGDFFEPLGDVDEMLETYYWLPRQNEGVAYGIPVLGYVAGMVYNKRIWEEAGVDDIPASPEQFLDGLEAIKENVPDAVPLYTNYAAGWPLDWDIYFGSVSGDESFFSTVITDDSPWDEGKDYEVVDGVLYDAVERGLTEADPTSTDWGTSKIEMGIGEIATMGLGSWALEQIRDEAEEAGFERDDIQFLPFPYQTDGEFNMVLKPDGNSFGISSKSDNKVTARAWIDFWNEESGFSELFGSFNPLRDKPAPAALGDIESLGNLVSIGEPTQEEARAYEAIQQEVGTFAAEEWRRPIIDAARLGTESKEDLFARINAEWAAARAQVVGE